MHWRHVTSSCHCPWTWSPCLVVLSSNLSLFSLSHSRSGGCHGPDSRPHASRVGWVDVVGGWLCLRVRRAAKKKMLCRLVVASAVWTRWRLLSSNTVKVAGEKWTVTCSQLSDSDALASGRAECPVGQWIGLSSQSAMRVWVRVMYVAVLKLLLPRQTLSPWPQTLSPCPWTWSPCPCPRTLIPFLVLQPQVLVLILRT